MNEMEQNNGTGHIGNNENGGYRGGYHCRGHGGRKEVGSAEEHVIHVGHQTIIS
ncbi:hypothetical protein KI387_042755, partial [Taxus chinensis]